MSIESELEKLFKRGYNHGLSQGQSEDGETHAVNDTEKAVLAEFERIKINTCKYCHISHGIGLDGEVTEFQVHCEMFPEIDYIETIKAKLHNHSHS